MGLVWLYDCKLQAIRASKTVEWSYGCFEWDNFAAGSTVANAMAACQGNTVVGGGDSAAPRIKPM